MNLSDDIVRQFKKYGGEGRYTLLIDDELEREFSESGILEGIPGKPLVISGITKDNQTIITSTHFGIRHKDRIDSISLDEVIDATVDLSSFKSGGPNLNDWTELVLVTKNGSHRIVVESGEPYMGIWNALKWVAAYNIRQQR